MAVIPVTQKQDLVSLVVPAYNEEERIRETLDELYGHFSHIPHEILVVMDGCTDNTHDIVEEFTRSHSTIRSVLYPVKLGKGGGILLGIKSARGTVIAVVDADGAVPPHDVGRMVDMVADGIDCVISSRYLPGSVIHIAQPWYRILASRGFNSLVKLLFSLPFKDTQCGCKVLRAEAARTVAGEIQTFDYAFDVELLWRLGQHGYTIIEVPVEWRHREGSKLDLKKVIPQMFSAVIKLRLKREG
ncbi:MAG: glycosyltransferase [ANME-2 cluster archaeon]|nr:glycosyltransferase [ANME-2 cluster archaeon]